MVGIKKRVTEAHELGDEDSKDAADPIEQLCHLLHPPKPGRINLYLYLYLYWLLVEQNQIMMGLDSKL